MKTTAPCDSAKGAFIAVVSIDLAIQRKQID